MFLKDYLIDIYQKASLEKNNLILENVINRWVHRFGIETMNELLLKKQAQIDLREEDQREGNQEQINLELLDYYKSQKETEFNSKEEKITNNNEIINKDIHESYKYHEAEELPLPNINNLRKWIKNEKKAS